MANNPILDELHATRKRLLAESGGTVSGLLDRLRADQATSKRPKYEPSENDTMHGRREPTPSEAADTADPATADADSPAV